MLTAAANGANATPRAVMQSIADIARRDGVSKPTVSNHVKRLVERANLTVERDGQGRVALVNVVEYDHLRGIVGDPSKTQAPARRAGPVVPDVAASETYNEALRQKTWHEAEKRGLELKEMRGELVRIDVIRRSALRIGQDVVHIFDRLPAAADDLATAVAREGTHGLRVALKRLAVELRTAFADHLAALASGAPETDEADTPDDLPVETSELAET